MLELGEWPVNNSYETLSTSTGSYTTSPILPLLTLTNAIKISWDHILLATHTMRITLNQLFNLVQRLALADTNPNHLMQNYDSLPELKAMSLFCTNYLWTASYQPFRLSPGPKSSSTRNACLKNENINDNSDNNYNNKTTAWTVPEWNATTSKK